MHTRRRLLQWLGLGLGAGVLGAPRLVCADSSLDLHAPAEGAPHAATWMAYGATAGAWGTRGAYGVSRSVAREDLIRIAATLARFEPVHMLVANERDLREAKARLQRTLAQTDAKDQVVRLDDAPHARGDARIRVSKSLPKGPSHGVLFHLCPLNDLWTRDIAPVFVRDKQGVIRGVDFNFNGWGQEPLRTALEGWRRDPEKAANGVQRQRVTEDMRVASFILKKAQTPRVSTWLTLEGGGVEVNGHGLAIVAESCVLNPNRNPGKIRAQVEAELRRLMGIEHVLWVRGQRAMEITDGHIDFYARFATPSTVVVNWDGGVAEDGELSVDGRNLRELKEAAKALQSLPEKSREAWMNASAEALTLTRLPVPSGERVASAVRVRTPAMAPRGVFQEESFAAGYVGYYEANGVLLMPQFGDPKADTYAFKHLEALYPGRTIVQITTDGLANGGGTIHCATQQQPRA